MTDRERKLRRSDRLRIGIILAMCLIIAVPVVATMAASPEPVQPAASATSAPETTAPSATDGAKTERNGAGKASRVGRGAITITAINGSNLSLRTDDGWTRTIAVTAETKITKGGQTITVADLEVGDQIRFSQSRSDAGAYTITRIRVPTPSTGGEVTAISGNTMTLKRRNGETQTVTLNGSTQYKSGDAAATKADVTVGSKVKVQGSASGETFTALTVHIVPTVVAGEVTAKSSNSLTLKRRDGSSIVVHVSADTKYGIRGKADGGLADIAVGDVAWAAGTLRADGSLDADGVAKGRGRLKKLDRQDAKPSPTAATTPG